jgi:pimeloyl-ACP methyl ester carboxylesterase
VLESLSVLLLFLLGAAAGGAIGYRLARQRPSPEQVQEIAQLQARVLELTASNAALTATLEQERGVAAERAAELASAREQLINSFKALSAEALQVNNEQFLNLARTQLEREPFPLPRLTIVRRPDSIFDYRFEDFEISGYQSHPLIKAPVAV